jgi:hypothetical protein
VSGERSLSYTLFLCVCEHYTIRAKYNSILVFHKPRHATGTIYMRVMHFSLYFLFFHKGESSVLRFRCGVTTHVCARFRRAKQLSLAESGPIHHSCRAELGGGQEFELSELKFF